MSLRYRCRFPYNEHRVYLGIRPTLSTEQPGLCDVLYIPEFEECMYTQSFTVMHLTVYVRVDKNMDNGCTLGVAYPCSDAYPSMPRVSTKHTMLSYTLSTIEKILQAFETSAVNSKYS